jgi:hypothetical protein
MWGQDTAFYLLLGLSLMAGQVHQPAEADFADAWGRHDAKAMAALHTEDVNFINIFGQWWKIRGSRKEPHAYPFRGWRHGT